MSDATKTPKPVMGNCQGKEDFVTKPGPVYLHNSIRYDLREIDRPVAEALANDPKCAFLQWKDKGKRPEKQRNAFAEEAAKSPAPKG